VSRRASIGLALVLVAGCGGGPRLVPRLAEMDSVRASAASQEGARLAPQAFAHAEEERTRAQKAYAAGDDLGAQIGADRAIAAYEHAFILARLARATHGLADANESLAAATDQAQRFAAARADVDREGQDLDKKVKIAKEAIALPSSAPADAAREAARLVAARALATQARLLCGAARLVGAEATAAADAEKDVTALETELATSPKHAPIDAAARARARCLTLLTQARRTATTSADADGLLAELSAAGGLDPSRDERGIVVTLRNAFKGTVLTPEADGRLRELGRVGAAHPAYALQVVLHDATAPKPAEATDDTTRADAAARALVAGGATATKVKAETAGDRAPIVDPADAAHRARNARLDVVFVAPAN
jgi:flagellar motor protein MotB